MPDRTIRTHALLCSRDRGQGDTSLANQLGRLGTGRVCVLGVGNRQRGDDGAGSILAARLAGTADTLCIDAGAVPENYLEKVARWWPDAVVIVDVADFGGAPGDVRLLDPTDIAASTFSTHALSLRMIAQYLEARTGAQVMLLAIQPADIGWGSVLTAPVSSAVDRLQETLQAALYDGTETCSNLAPSPASA